jgi:uncharacterized protein YqeY
MELYGQLENDMRSALKEGNSLRLSVIRMLISDIKKLEIDRGAKPQEGDILQILQRQAKQRRESIEQYRNGNRHDLADKEAGELTILEAYIPLQLTGAELEALVKEALSETGASTKADTGKVMKAVMDKARGRCDGKAVSQIVARLLQ